MQQQHGGQQQRFAGPELDELIHFPAGVRKIFCPQDVELATTTLGQQPCNILLPTRVISQQVQHSRMRRILCTSLAVQILVDLLHQRAVFFGNPYRLRSRLQKTLKPRIELVDSSKVVQNALFDAQCGGGEPLAGFHLDQPVVAQWSRRCERAPMRVGKSRERKRESDRAALRPAHHLCASGGQRGIHLDSRA